MKQLNTKVSYNSKRDISSTINIQAIPQRKLENIG